MRDVSPHCKRLSVGGPASSLNGHTVTHTKTLRPTTLKKEKATSKVDSWVRRIGQRITTHHRTLLVGDPETEGQILSGGIRRDRLAVVWLQVERADALVLGELPGYAELPEAVPRAALAAAVHPPDPRCHQPLLDAVEPVGVRVPAMEVAAKTSDEGDPGLAEREQENQRHRGGRGERQYGSFHG